MISGCIPNCTDRLTDYKADNEGSNLSQPQGQQNGFTDEVNQVKLSGLPPLSFCNRNNPNNFNLPAKDGSTFLTKSDHEKSRCIPQLPRPFHVDVVDESKRAKRKGLSALPRELLERILNFAGHESVDVLCHTCGELAQQLPVNSASFWWRRWREEVCGPNGLGALLVDPQAIETMHHRQREEIDKSQPHNNGVDAVELLRSPCLPTKCTSGMFGICSKKSMSPTPTGPGVSIMTWINPPRVYPSEDSFHMNKAESYAIKCERTPPISLFPLRIWASCDSPRVWERNETVFFSDNAQEDSEASGKGMSVLNSAATYLHQITSKKLSLYHLFEVFCPNPEDCEESQKRTKRKNVLSGLVDERKSKYSPGTAPRKVTVIIPDTGKVSMLRCSAGTESVKSSQSLSASRHRRKHRIRFCAQQYREAIRLIHRWKLAQKKEEEIAREEQEACHEPVVDPENENDAILSDTSFKEFSSSPSSVSFESSVSSPAGGRYKRVRQVNLHECTRGPLSRMDTAAEASEQTGEGAATSLLVKESALQKNHSLLPSDSLVRSDSQQLRSMNSLASGAEELISRSSGVEEKKSKLWKQSHQTFSDAIKKKTTRKYSVLKPSSTCGTLQTLPSGKWINAQGDNAFVYNRRMNLLSYNNTLTDLSEEHPSYLQDPPIDQGGRSPTFISVPNSPMFVTNDPCRFDQQDVVQEVQPELMDSVSDEPDSHISSTSDPGKSSGFHWSPERNWSLFHPDYKYILYNGSATLSPSSQPFHSIVHSSINRFWTAGYLSCFMTAKEYQEHHSGGGVNDDESLVFEGMEPTSNRETQRTSFSLLQPLNDILSTHHSPVRPFSSTTRAFPTRHSPAPAEGSCAPLSHPVCSLFEWTHVLSYQERHKMYDTAYTQSNFLFSSGLNATEETLENLNSVVPCCAGLLFPIAIPPDTSLNVLKLWKDNSGEMVYSSHLFTGVSKIMNNVLGSGENDATVPQKVRSERIWFRAQLVRENNVVCQQKEGNACASSAPLASAATLLYAPSHIALYLSLLRFTSIFDLQHARGESEDRYLVHTRIISPVTGKVVSLSFFYRHRHVGCPLMWIKMEFLLPKREFERVSKVLDNETDDDSDTDAGADAGGDLSSVYPSRRGSSNSAGATNRNSDDDEEERVLLFQGGMGRVELDVAPQVDRRGMHVLMEALSLPPRFPLTLLWNVVIYASMMGVEVWEQFGSTFFTTYRSTFTDAVLRIVAQEEEEAVEKSCASDRQQRTPSASIQTTTSSGRVEHLDGSMSPSSSSTLSSFV